MSTAEIFGQIFGVIALAFCIAGFANRNDDRLMVLLISANVAFALMFACFQSWTAAALTVLVIVRITLARRYPGNRVFLAVLLAVNLVVAWATWKSVTDIFPLTAAVLGTFGTPSALADRPTSMEKQFSPESSAPATHVPARTTVRIISNHLGLFNGCFMSPPFESFV